MSRKIVSLILMPFVLLTQSVTFGHSHAGNQPAGHELRAHIHLDISIEDAKHGLCIRMGLTATATCMWSMLM